MLLMKGYKIFILYNNSLFARGLESLFKREEGLKVVGMARTGPDVLSQIFSFRPDVIVVEGGEERLERESTLFQILRESPGGCLVCLNPGGERAIIYSSHEVTNPGTEELINIIRTQLGSNSSNKVSKN